MQKTVSILKALFINVAFLTLVPMLIAVAISVVMFHRETVERIRLENLRVAQTVSMAVDMFLSRPEVMLKQVRVEVDQNCDAELSNLKSVANRILDTDPLFESVLFIDGVGNLLGTAGPEESAIKNGVQKQSFSESNLFKRIKSSKRITWSEPFVSLRTGASVIAVAIPWRGGMISGTMNLAFLCKLVEPARTVLKSYAFIVSPAGSLVAHPDSALLGEKEAFLSLPQITAGFHGTSGTYSFVLEDRKVIGSVVPYKYNDWVIVSVHDRENAFASLYRIEAILGLLTFVVLAGALMFSFRRVGRITASILALSDSIRRIASGESISEPLKAAAYKETHELFENFQAMAVAVAERESALQERNEELAVTEEELKSQVEEYLKTYDALIAEKAKLESILASMGEGLSMQDRDYRVILQNQAHRDLVGDAVGCFCYEAYNHKDSICPECPLKLAYEDGKTHVVLRQINKGGKEVFYEIAATPLHNSAGEIIGGLEVVRDITSRVLADQEIRRLNQELETRVIERTAELEIANRELESFSYSVSHDLRAPLRHISSFSTILENEHAGQLDKEGRHFISRILAACDKMGVLIDELLELSRVTRHELKTGRVNLSGLVNRISAVLIEKEPQKKVNFNIEEGLHVYGDERLLEVMLDNLLGNAWKYSAQKEAACIEFGRRTIASRPVFFIKDNGAGFDKNYYDKLFVPFQRLHGVDFEGTGIGLAIVQRIINRHGGKIWADSVVGEGAVFYFTLKD